MTAPLRQRLHEIAHNVNGASDPQQTCREALEYIDALLKRVPLHICAKCKSEADPACFPGGPGTSPYCEPCLEVDRLLDLALDCWCMWTYTHGDARDERRKKQVVVFHALRSTLLDAGRIGEDGMPLHAAIEEE